MDSLKFILLSCAIPLYQCASHSDCDIKTQYFKVDRCCYKCGPGSYMVAECDTSEYSSCKPCLNDFYQPVWTKEDHCRKHSACDPAGGFEVIKAGDTLKDVECLCKEGKLCANRDCEVCKDDKICLPGQEVKIPGDQKHVETTCEDCKVGFYSNMTSSTEPCRKWVDCASLGLIEVKPGTSQTDAVCSVQLQVNTPYRAAVGCLAVLLIILIVLFICSRMGYLDQAIAAIRSQINKRMKPEGKDLERVAQETDVENDRMFRAVQEVGKDSHPSEEERQDQSGIPLRKDCDILEEGINGNAGRECMN
ncbi:tumor necrosis factor receptor superfamily member 5-like [Heterodontus francisci]|uniref:tumor necrosis factor receptor superfamily member 5-like n=1 Tax=Heterodontus francisci TaxID=7792 RepID=UPI00355C4F39